MPAPSTAFLRGLRRWVVLATLVEISAGLLKRFGLPNMLLYNLYWPVEFGLLLTLPSTLAPVPRWCQATLMILFLLGYGWNITGLDPRRELASLSVISGALMLAGTYLFVLWNGTGQWSGHLRDTPAFWLCLAVLLYYGACGPLLGSINYFMRTDMPLARHLYRATQVLCVAKFLLMAMACYSSYRPNPHTPHRTGY
jgi:hypothetical protein